MNIGVLPEEDKIRYITNMFHVKHFMKNIVLFLFGLNLCACTVPSEPRSVESDTIGATSVGDTVAVTTDTIPEAEPYANYYIVIADTGRDYSPLFEKIKSLSSGLDLKINLMDRSYNKMKDLIALPENFEDEIYAGEYYPRREPSEFLSLEYLNFYNPASNPKTIALVAGIYGNVQDADNALTKLKQKESKGFKMLGRVYVGCMH